MPTAKRKPPTAMPAKKAAPRPGAQPSAKPSPYYSKQKPKR